MELNLNGYTDLPAGKVASIVTYLQMTEPPALAARPSPAGLRLERQHSPSIDNYRALLRTIGEPWLWFSRLQLSDDALASKLNQPATEVWFLFEGSEPAGLLEFDVTDPHEIEITFFGVVPSLIGRGAGSWLMQRALELAWARLPQRVWLHTCTLDHPGAIAFYRKHGFQPYRLAIEVDDDPRLTGALPRSAAPHVPIFP